MCADLLAPTLAERTYRGAAQERQACVALAATARVARQGVRLERGARVPAVRAAFLVRGRRRGDRVPHLAGAVARPHRRCRAVSLVAGARVVVLAAALSVAHVFAARGPLESARDPVVRAPLALAHQRLGPHQARQVAGQCVHAQAALVWPRALRGVAAAVFAVVCGGICFVGRGTLHVL